MKSKNIFRMTVKLLTVVLCFCMCSGAMADYYPKFKWKVKNGKMALEVRKSQKEKEQLVTDYIFSRDYKESFLYGSKEPKSIVPLSLDKKQVSDYLFLVEANVGKGIVNGMGEAVVPYGEYSAISPSCLYDRDDDKSFYLKVKKEKWGILKLKNENGRWVHQLLTDCEYDKITQFKQINWFYTEWWYSPWAEHKEVTNLMGSADYVVLPGINNGKYDILKETDKKAIRVHGDSYKDKPSFFLCENGGKARVFNAQMDTYWSSVYLDTDSYIDPKTKEIRLTYYVVDHRVCFAMIQDSVPGIYGIIDSELSALKVMDLKPSDYNSNRDGWVVLSGQMNREVLTNHFNNSKRMEIGGRMRVLLNDSVDYYGKGIKHEYRNKSGKILYCSVEDYTNYEVPADHDGWFTCQTKDGKRKVGMIEPRTYGMLYFDNAKELLSLSRETPLDGSWNCLQYEGYGLHNTSTGLIIPTVYQEVKPLEGTSCVLVRHIDKWGLVGPNGMLAPAIFNSYEVKNGLIAMKMDRWQPKYGFFNYETPLYPKKVNSPYVLIVSLSTLEVADNFGTLLSYYEKGSELELKEIHAELVSLAYYLDNEDYHAMCLYYYGTSLFAKDEKHLDHSLMCVHKANCLSKDKLYANTEEELKIYWRDKKEAEAQAAAQAAAQVAREAAEAKARRRQAIINALNNLSAVINETAQQLSSRHSSGKGNTARTSLAASAGNGVKRSQTTGSTSVGDAQAKNNSSKKWNTAIIKRLENAYDECGRHLLKMRYGYYQFDAKKAKDIQCRMRDIRLQLEKDYDVTWLSTTWENWNFVSDPPKK